VITKKYQKFHDDIFLT